MSAEYFDIVIVGAGLSGIGAAYHLQAKCPSKRYVILEGREALGGTWDLFRYPGIRSDSDMYTLGYGFKPWRDAKAIADGPSILQYLQETATENGIDKRIRYGHRVRRAHWSSAEATWTLEVARQGVAEAVCFRCNFLLMCSGYYSYAGGYTPEFKGRDRFTGTIVHPQNWPETLDYRGKRAIVIGSGATAITLVPAMAKAAQHVTMLQRSPSYIASRPERDASAEFLRRFLPERLAYAITRWKSIAFQQIVYQRTRANPEQVKQKLLQQVRQELGPDYDIETHFTPRYNPWDQRVCLAPNGDLFRAIAAGKVSVATDSIDTFTEQGIRLQSGEALEADIIVTATGLNILLLGGVEFAVDGRPVDFSQAYTYKGIMYSDVPNLVSIFGYVNASWTLRSDLVAAYTCRLINYMNKVKARQCVPRLRAADRNMPKCPFAEGFSPGYLQRAKHLLPKQGDREPWIAPQNYKHDRKALRHHAIADGVMAFENPKRSPTASSSSQIA